MISQENTTIGKILGSNSHVDYVCEVYDKSMKENPPDPTDYEFSQFVYCKKNINQIPRIFVGIIYNTQIIDPDQGRTGPRLASPEDQELFYPTYVDEKRILAGIALLGHSKIKDKTISDVDHSIPKWTLEVDDLVKKMPIEDVIDFHTIDEEIRLEYYQRLIQITESFANDILENILGQIEEKKPEESKALNVIRKNLEWQTRMRGV